MPTAVVLLNDAFLPHFAGWRTYTTTGLYAEHCYCCLRALTLVLPTSDCLTPTAARLQHPRRITTTAPPLVAVKADNAYA